MQWLKVYQGVEMTYVNLDWVETIRVLEAGQFGPVVEVSMRGGRVVPYQRAHVVEVITDKDEMDYMISYTGLLDDD